MTGPPELNDADLSIPRLTWGILLVSVSNLHLEMPFIRRISTEFRIFAHLQNSILVVCFLGLVLLMTYGNPLLVVEFPASLNALHGKVGKLRAKSI